MAANREIAFVQAIISAGIVFTVTRNCSLGQLEDCKCMARKNKREESAKTGFLWGGCSDNTELGSRIAVTYLDEREMGHDFKAVVRLHNHEVGRQVSNWVNLKKLSKHLLENLKSIYIIVFTMNSNLIISVFTKYYF